MFKFSDFFGLPFKNGPWFSLWVWWYLLTFFPGTILWLCTFGCFRYWHLTEKLLNYLVQKDLDTNYA